MNLKIHLFYTTLIFFFFFCVQQSLGQLTACFFLVKKGKREKKTSELQ